MWVRWIRRVRVVRVVRACYSIIKKKSNAHTTTGTKVEWTENEIPLLATWTVDATYLAREHTIISVEVQESKGLMANRWKTAGFCELWLGPICCRYPIGSEARYVVFNPVSLFQRQFVRLSHILLNLR